MEGGGEIGGGRLGVGDEGGEGNWVRAEESKATGSLRRGLEYMTKGEGCSTRRGGLMYHIRQWDGVPVSRVPQHWRK